MCSISKATGGHQVDRALVVQLLPSLLQPGAGTRCWGEAEPRCSPQPGERGPWMRLIPSAVPRARHRPGEGRPGSLAPRNQTLPKADKRDGAGCLPVESPSSLLLAAQSSHLELFAVDFSPISISKAKLAGCRPQALFRLS